VITNAMFEESYLKGKVTRPSDGQGVSKAAFLQCAGSRDPQYLPYCSTVCCNTSLKQALKIKAENPKAEVYVVFKEMRTPGQAEDLYRKAQEEGVIFIRCQSPEVKVDGGKVRWRLWTTLASGSLGAGSRGPGHRHCDDGFWPDISKTEAQEEKKEDKKEEELLVPPDLIRRSEILNLEYRQGPELPALKYDFPDSHFICFPYETRRTGIYAAGCSHRPMGIGSTKEDGAGAAMKAIQCIELTSRGAAVHPRAGDLTFPEFAMQRCTQCKRCTVEVTLAPSARMKANPLPQPTRAGCGGVHEAAGKNHLLQNYSVG
jgi:quinone-modifying oxidoreductase subunit QmoB